ncbi:MAG: symmetrical bis(5'-nucleosyl)-tetraphosphatase, partial [Burkholderiaceae bacterium]
LVVLGDLINRGPASLAALRRLIALGGSGQCLLGNHDLHLLAVSQGVRRPHRVDTIGDILAAPDREALLDWLRQRPLALMERGWLLVHAGVLPEWDAAQTIALAGEAQSMLRDDDAFAAFVPRMYGDLPARWDDALRGDDRLRVIVNALTRLRFCSADGTMEFSVKDGAAAAPPGYAPWFDIASRRTAGTPIAFGHWSTLGLVDRPDLLALDTGCVWGGHLTAARIDGGRHELFQVRCAPR